MPANRHGVGLDLCHQPAMLNSASLSFGTKQPIDAGVMTPSTSEKVCVLVLLSV